MFPTKYASIFKRFVAFFIDWLITSLISFAVFIILVLIMLPETFQDWMYDLRPRWLWIGDPLEYMDFEAYTAITLIFFSFLILPLLYFALFESSARQATPGKMVMGIFVTDLDGNRISFLKALGRTLAKVLSKAICYVGYIVALFTARNQALHDLLANTLVLEPDHASARADKTVEADREVDASIEDESSPAD